MTDEWLQETLLNSFPDLVFEPGTEWLQVTVQSQQWLPLANTLRYKVDMDFDFLFCVTCIDWKTHLAMVYHLRSTTTQSHLVVKVTLDPLNPEIDSVTSIWKTADFHEREVYEMFGVNFIGHPDLRLLILPDGWEGRNPLRKDFEDPINMIRL
jgi:NADH:ubiquinone oxidoreductase subunit C